MVCYDCGLEVSSKETKYGIKVFDSESEKWQSDCPSCGSIDFHTKGQEYVTYY